MNYYKHFFHGTNITITSKCGDDANTQLFKCYKLAFKIMDEKEDTNKIFFYLVDKNVQSNKDLGFEKTIIIGQPDEKGILSINNPLLPAAKPEYPLYFEAIEKRCYDDEKLKEFLLNKEH